MALPWDSARHKDSLGVPTLRIGISSLISIRLEKPKI
jgi:hypothetical protein